MSREWPAVHTIWGALLLVAALAAGGCASAGTYRAQIAPLLVTPTTIPAVTQAALALPTPTPGLTLASPPIPMLQLAPDLSPSPAPTVTPMVTPVVTPVLIPLVTETAVAVAAPAPDEPYRFSMLEGDLAAGYPAGVVTGRFVLHYMPDTPPAQEPQQVAELVMAVLAHHEALLDVALSGPLDVYAAGTLFAPPDQALRGRSFSQQRRTFFLARSADSSADQAYIAAHELTHVVAWNTLGTPASVMLSEGLAVYAGMDFVSTGVAGIGVAGGQELLPLREFCAALYQASALPQVSHNLDYLGHIRNLENYYAAGCFVQFLVERYGTAPLAVVYPSGDFWSAYGKGLGELEAEWLADVTQQPPAAIDPAGLASAVRSVSESYDHVLAEFAGEPAQMVAYEQLEQARVALLSGRLEEARAWLAKAQRTATGE